MELSKRLKAFAGLGNYLRHFLSAGEESRDGDLSRLVNSSSGYNAWFTKQNVLQALSGVADMLDEKALQQWTGMYGDRLQAAPGRKIAVVMAGNIPMVGFHDMLCVLISGNSFIGKISSQDPYLIPFLAKKLTEIEPDFAGRITFTERLTGFDAVIATGSNNSARYFDYYFGKYPSIIRKNRNSIAVLDGTESKEDLQNLGKDIFSYFGLGCRNVSKLLVPAGYKLDSLFEALEDFSEIRHHSKYFNNYEYNKAIYLVNRVPFLDNNFIMMKEDLSPLSPIGVLYYEGYTTIGAAENRLNEQKENIQCIVSSRLEGAIPFGKAQYPKLWDYADNIDTLEFLLNLE